MSEQPTNQPIQPTPAQALALLEQVAAQFRGTRQDHAMIAQAFEILTDAITPPVDIPGT